MSTITAILEADADGTLHLPLPAELRHGKIEVTATLKAANGVSPTLPQAASEPARRLAAFQALQQSLALTPAAAEKWTRETAAERKAFG